MREIIIKPQPGFQTAMLSSPADIVFGGGAAGAGKTFALLLDPMRYKDIPGFTGVIFRRTTPQIRNEGGLWDTTQQLYKYLGGIPKDTTLSWYWLDGGKVKFSHMEYENNKYDHQGAQYTFIGFDELTHFSESQFFFMLSRNRSACGVLPYIRATLNPDPDSWVAEFISWWIDQDTGYPIPERSGVVRYFTRSNNIVAWGDTKQAVIDQVPEIFNEIKTQGIKVEDLIKSFTFIPGNIYENQELLKINPQYLGNLLSLNDEEKLRLLAGNWKIRQDGTGLFDFQKTHDLFSNFVEKSEEKYITCDAARFGRDLAVIMVWKGWKVEAIYILTKSKTTDIVDTIEKLRASFSVSKSDVLVDQDGVGGGVVDQGGYNGFSSGAAVILDPGTKIKEAYANLKTQCYYRFADVVNSGKCQIDLTNTHVDGARTDGILIGREYKEVRKMIIEDLRAIRREKVDHDGKKQINSKEKQKIILGGRSPDFGDTLMMRVVFELRPRKSFTFLNV